MQRRLCKKYAEKAQQKQNPQCFEARHITAGQIADVSGKGAGAALLMAKLQSTLRALIPESRSLTQLAEHASYSNGMLYNFYTVAIASGVAVLLAAGVGWLVGGETQKAAGLSGTAYRISREEGGETVVRSPGRKWSPGDRVHIVGARLVAVGDTGDNLQSVDAAMR